MTFAPRARNALPTLALTALALLGTADPAHAQDADDEDSQEIVVQGTRTGHNLNDEPIRVEVIVREDIEEKQMMTPGNVAMMVTESPGVRTQVTSPSLGAASIRM